MRVTREPAWKYECWLNSQKCMLLAYMRERGEQKKGRGDSTHGDTVLIGKEVTQLEK